jgi:hypothetical protein
MPNWCLTNYVVEGDMKELKSLHKKLLSLGNSSETQHDNLWLEKVVELFGGDIKTIRCRGWITDLPQLDAILSFETETAWCEMNEVWDLVMSRYKTLRYYYAAEEPGCIYYCTNDSNFKYFHRYLIDDCKDERKYCNTQEQLLLYVSESIGITLTSLKMMELEIDRYNEDNEDNSINIYEFEITEIGLF